MRSQCSPIENQGQISSCTANALVGNLEFLEKQNEPKVTALSRLFIYFNERNVEHDPSQDSGAQLRDGIKVLKKFGACKEKTWPYKESLLFEKPSSTAYDEAKENCISKYERISGLNQMKDCLASGFPFVFGIKVYKSFESDLVKETGIVEMPEETDSFLGGHAVMAVGYDDVSKRLLCRNSWGKEWGMEGYFSLPYAYLESPLSFDYWTIQK